MLLYIVVIAHLFGGLKGLKYKIHLRLLMFMFVRLGLGSINEAR
jgi:hypothetical protein